MLAALTIRRLVWMMETLWCFKRRKKRESFRRDGCPMAVVISLEV